jgi:hypothetical protein
MSTNTPFDPASASAQLTATLPAALGSADSDSADAVGNLVLVLQARLSSRTRAATLAAAQYGSDSTQAKAAQSAINAGNTAVARTQLASRQINAPKPAVGATGWALQGYVLDSSGTGLNQYTVFLVDEQKAYLREYSFAYTDSTGTSSSTTRLAPKEAPPKTHPPLQTSTLQWPTTRQNTSTSAPPPSRRSLARRPIRPSP